MYDILEQEIALWATYIEIFQHNVAELWGILTYLKYGYV